MGAEKCINIQQQTAAAAEHAGAGAGGSPLPLVNTVQALEVTFLSGAKVISPQFVRQSISVSLLA